MKELMVWFQWVIESSILVIPVILFILLLRNGIKRVSGLLTYVLWLVVWIRLICPVGIPSEIRLSTLPDPVLKTLESWFDRNDAPQELMTAQDMEQGKVYNGGEQKDWKKDSNIPENAGISQKNAEENSVLATIGTVDKKNAEAGNSSESNFFARNFTDSRNMFCLIWFTGMVLAFLYEGVLAFLFHRKKLCYAVKQGKGVYCCGGISSAFVSGIFHGKIYLPFGMEERERGYILEHEREHIRRKDYFVKKLCFAVCLVYWFHPLVWLAWHFLCYDMEIACDEAVLRKLEPVQRKEYSYVLLSNAVGGKRQIPFYQPQFGKNMVKNRIWHSIQYKEEKLEIVLVGVFIVVLAAVLCMTVRKDVEVVPMKKGGSYTKETGALYQKKVEDASDEEALNKLLFAVISKDFLESYDETIEPFTCTVQADVLQIHLNMWISLPDSFRRLSGDYSAIFLALIPQIRMVQWQYEEVQEGGFTKTVNLQYDWSMMQKEDFIDALICQVAKSAEAKDFGASASSLQQLIDSFTFYEKGKTPVEKEALAVFDEEQMKRELRDLPGTHKRSYEEATKCEELYVEQFGYYHEEEGEELKLIKKEYRTKLWDEFLEKTERGEAASLVLAGHNVLEDAKVDEDGSVCFTYLCFDGVKYYALYDYVGKDRKDSFNMVSGKYLLYSEDTINDISMGNYYITDDASLSYRDGMYAPLYGGMTEYISFARPELYVVRSIYL